MDSEIINLTKEQVLILQLNDIDIEVGRLISQDQLDKDDRSGLPLLVLSPTCYGTD